MKTKIILNYIIGFVISILICLTALFLIMKLSIFDKSYIISFLDKENYYDKVFREIQEEMENDIMPSGFTNDIIKDTFTKEEVKNDIIIFINNMYEGKETSLNKEELKNHIQENINSFLKKSNLSITDQDGLNNFIDDLVNVYKNEVCLYSYANSFINIFFRISKIINKVVIGLSILLVILFILSKKLLNFAYLSSSIFASGLIILFIRMFIFERIDAENLLIITENFSNIVTIIINNIGTYLYYIGIGLIVFGIILSCKVFLKNVNYAIKENKILQKNG